MLFLGLHWELIVSSHPHVFIADFRFVLVLRALDDTVGWSECHRRSIPESLAIACAVVTRSPGIAGTSSCALSQPPALSSTVPVRQLAAPPLLGGALSFSPPNIDCGLLTRPNLFPRLCNFVVFEASLWIWNKIHAKISSSFKEQNGLNALSVYRMLTQPWMSWGPSLKHTFPPSPPQLPCFSWCWLSGAHGSSSCLCSKGAVQPVWKVSGLAVLAPAKWDLHLTGEKGNKFPDAKQLAPLYLRCLPHCI